MPGSAGRVENFGNLFIFLTEQLNNNKTETPVLRNSFKIIVDYKDLNLTTWTILILYLENFNFSILLSWSGRVRSGQVTLESKNRSVADAELFFSGHSSPGPAAGSYNALQRHPSWLEMEIR